MKRFLLVLNTVLFINNIATGQYKIDRLSYDYSTYSYQAGDRYSPALAGIASSILPGLGQAVTGEPGRGAAFFGGVVGSIGVVMLVSVLTFDYDNQNPVWGIVGYSGVLGIYIWNIADAVRVAKVNNLAFRDKNRILCDLQIKPYLNTSYYTQDRSVSAGLSIKFRF